MSTARPCTATCVPWSGKLPLSTNHAHLGNEAAAARNQDLGCIQPATQDHTLDLLDTKTACMHIVLCRSQHFATHRCCVSTPHTRICRSYTAASALESAAMIDHRQRRAAWLHRLGTIE